MMNMMANGALGTGGIWFGGFLSIVTIVGVALLALWFYRFVKDSPKNKQVLAWALGILVAAFAIANLTTYGYGGMLSGRANGQTMMGNAFKSMMNDPEVRQDMRNTMQGVWQNTNGSNNY